MPKKINSSGEREMKIHMKTVKGARKSLTSDAKKLGKKISSDITFALSQDAKILADMRKADKAKSQTPSRRK